MLFLHVVSIGLTVVVVVIPNAARGSSLYATPPHAALLLLQRHG